MAELPNPSHGPEVRQDFACHTSGWLREIRRGLLAAPRDLGGPLAGAAGWVRVGEKVEERHLLFFLRLLLRSRLLASELGGFRRPSVASYTGRKWSRKASRSAWQDAFGQDRNGRDTTCYITFALLSPAFSDRLSTMENETKSARRVTMALRTDLNDRVFKKAEELGQNANYFVNQCIEGILDAMDADDISHDIPVLKLDRIMKGKTMLDSKWVNALCAFIVPNVDVE